MDGAKLLVLTTFTLYKGNKSGLQNIPSVS